MHCRMIWGIFSFSFHITILIPWLFWVLVVGQERLSCSTSPGKEYGKWNYGSPSWMSQQLNVVLLSSIPGSLKLRFVQFTLKIFFAMVSRSLCNILQKQSTWIIKEESDLVAMSGHYCCFVTRQSWSKRTLYRWLWYWKRHCTGRYLQTGSSRSLPSDADHEVLRVP